MNPQFIPYWHDMTETEFKTGVITSCTGGATWIRMDSGVYFVVPVLTPVEIARKLVAGETVRVQVKLYLC